MRVLLVSGSTRSGSANTAALVTAAALAPPGVTAVLYQGLAGLPAFNPDHDGELLPESAATLRRDIEEADAVLFCTPEYAGTLPGSLKNLLDWTVGGGQLYEKPVAWLNVAAANRGQGAQETLASVLGYVGAVVVGPACRHIPVDRSAIRLDGMVSDPGFADGLGEIWTQLARHAGTRRDLYRAKTARSARAARISTVIPLIAETNRAWHTWNYRVAQRLRVIGRSRADGRADGRAASRSTGRRRAPPRHGR
jgi:chromate reductase, NAD(P)H dehydrogenase (quinone)